MRCRLDDLEANGYRDDVYLYFKPVTADGTFRITATVTADSTDPEPSNNSGTEVLEVSTAPDLYVTFPNLPRAPLDPGQSVTISVAVTDRSKQLVRAGNIRLTVSSADATIEGAEAEGWNCTIGPAALECSAPFLASTLALDVAVRATSDRTGHTAVLSASVTSESPEFNPKDNSISHEQEIYRWIAVSTTADSGSGSLRAAFQEANRHCTRLSWPPDPAFHPCKVVFEIPSTPADGAFVIRPLSPLPVLDVWQLIIDGASQETFAGDRNPAGPEIFLDGSAAGATSGIVLAACEGTVEGLAIGNFAGFGIEIDDRAGCYQYPPLYVIDNYLGTDATGTVAAPNTRGLSIDSDLVIVHNNVISGNRRAGVWDAGYFDVIERNRIGVAADGVTPLPNGASGVFVAPDSAGLQVIDNVISHNAEMGIASSHYGVGVFRNSMRSNGGLGFDIGLDGETPPAPDDSHAPTNPPLLVAAQYDPATNTTTIVGIVGSKPLQSYYHSFDVALYANDSPEAEGETFLTSFAPNSGDARFTASVPADLRGKWINATLTRIKVIAFSRVESDFYEPSYKATSELSKPILVPGGDRSH